MGVTGSVLRMVVEKVRMLLVLLMVEGCCGRMQMKRRKRGIWEPQVSCRMMTGCSSDGMRTHCCGRRQQRGGAVQRVRRVERGRRAGAGGARGRAAVGVHRGVAGAVFVVGAGVRGERGRGEAAGRVGRGLPGDSVGGL